MSGPTRATRLAVLRRDGGQCVRCGRVVADPDSGAPLAEYSLQHRKPRGMGGSRDPQINSATNLIVLDGDGVTGCHGWVEANREDARLMGWLVPQWRNPAEVPVRHHGHGWAWARPNAWVPLTTAELWLQAGQWLADALRINQIENDDVAGVTRLSRAAADLFGVMAGDVKEAVA
jgi:hypothetical protein